MRRWVVCPRAPKTDEIASLLDIHPAIASVLLRRGLNQTEDIARFLNPRLDSLQSPFIFRDMKKAADRIHTAISKKEKILIYGDYDVDGVAGSAILELVLKKMGADAQTYLPHRMTEGYGLHQQVLEELMMEGFSIVITVDTGMSGIEPIRYLSGQGVDVIVVDHHLPKDEFPPAFAMVSAAVGEGDANLAGCGLAFEVAWALLGDLKAAEEYLELAVIGTVADQTDVTGENRILLKHGLARLSRTKRPGLVALMEVARLQAGSLSYRDIAFGLAPRINAAGRMGSALTAFQLLTTQDAAQARQFASELDGANRARQKIEAKAFEEAEKEVAPFLEAHHPRAIVVGSANWHEGVVGIVASRLVERFRRPAVVIALREEIGKGSGRSVPGFSLFDAVRECEHFLLNFGGHAQALGLTIHKEKISHFRERLNAVIGEHASSRGAVTAPLLEIEGEISPRELDLKFVQDLEKLAPFGPGNRKPLFLSKGMRMKGSPKKRGTDTLSLWMADAEGMTVCEIVGFRQYERWVSQSSGRGDPAGRPYEIVYRPSLSEFRGIASIQLELEDWR